jgi:hypothetical protein
VRQPAAGVVVLLGIRDKEARLSLNRLGVQKYTGLSIKP